MRKGLKMTFTAENFFEETTANFVSCDAPNRPCDYESYSGSKYWYSENGVIRASNHWGAGVASCNWYLNGGAYGEGMHPYKRVWTGERYKFIPEYADGATSEQIARENETVVCGFCAWSDFSAK